MSISQYDTLFNLLGTTYGGDGQQTFALPDLQGRVPVSKGGNYVIGQKGGAEQVTLNTNSMPAHSHAPMASNVAGSSNLVAGHLLASSNNPLCYVTPAAVDTAMNPGMITPAGGSLPHDNMQPFLAMNWIIALYGIYPSQN